MPVDRLGSHGYLLSVDIAVGDDGVIPLLDQAFAKIFGKADRSVMPAGTADIDNQAVSPLFLIQRDEKKHHIIELVRKGVTFRERKYIIIYRLIQSGQRAEPNNSLCDCVADSVYHNAS